MIILRELDQCRIPRSSFFVRELVSVVFENSIIKEIGEEVVFIFHNRSFACHRPKQLAVVEEEVVALGKIFKRIGHTVATTEVFFVGGLASDVLGVPRISIVFQ